MIERTRAAESDPEHESIPVAVVITAAGTSSRFSRNSGQNLKKEFVRLDGESVLSRTVRIFVETLVSVSGGTSAPPWHLELLVVTCTPGLLEETSRQLTDFPSVRIRLTEGGTVRQQSVRLGLEAVLQEMEHSKEVRPVRFVMIHDGSRPWVTGDLILDTLVCASRCGGAAPAVPLVDALKQIDASGMVIGHEDRSRFVGIQTPQTFRFPDILTAHRAAAVTGNLCHDDTEVYTRWGGRVGTVPGNRSNLKITYYEDLETVLSDSRKYKEQQRCASDTEPTLTD